jgi:L-xylulokinase
MQGHLLGLDCGLTMTKAVVFDSTGTELGQASVRIPHSSPQPRWVERNMDDLWHQSARVIRSAIGQAGVRPESIAAVGVAGHGDGLYLVGADGGPVRAAILSMDSRAFAILERWRAEGVMDEALALTGQVPWPATPAALLAWLREHEPQALANARFALGCKDWLKLRLTGAASTDPTEASLSFTDVRTQAYASAALDLYGLAECERLLPPVIDSPAVAGRVSRLAAAETGLAEGTPVVSGLHDVDACAIGTGCTGPGRLSVIAGSFSINQVISDHPVVDSRWSCRNFGTHGRWMNMAVSPASATNLEWFVRDLLEADGARPGGGGFGFVDAEVAAVLSGPREVWYLPYLYGSPVSDRASGAFAGLRGWHRRGHLLRALLEGVVFNHRMHVEALRSAFPDLAEARLTGGGARSRVWVQMFADALEMPITLTASEETGALGAAICAGVGAGLFPDVAAAAEQVVRVGETFTPDTAGVATMRNGYAGYLRLVEALKPFWEAAETA